MKKSIVNKIIPTSSEEFSKLVGDDFIKLEFFDDTVGLKNGSMLKKIQFSENDEDENDGKANILGVLVNNCRNETHFQIFFNEIKRIYNSNGTVIWENPNL